MKILYIIISLDAGGAENSLLRLCEKLILENNIGIRIVTLYRPGILASKFEKLGINVYSLDLDSILKIPFGFFKLFNFLKNYNPTVVHTWMYHSNLFGGVVAFLLRKPVIWSIRCTHPSAGNFSVINFFNLLSAFFSYFIPKEIICVSESSILSHIKYGYNRKIMTVLPNGYEEESGFFNDLNPPNDLNHIINSNSLIITSIGRNNIFKDHDTFIDAVSKVLSSNQNIYVLIVGNGLDYNNQNLVNKILSKNLNLNKFLLLGYRDDVKSILAYSNIYCLHSISEGFPNSLAEAMLLGVPCVSTDVGDVSLIVGDEYKNYVVPKRDPIKLSLAIQHLIELSDYDRKQIGKYLKFRILSNYGINILVKKIICKYEKTKSR